MAKGTADLDALLHRTRPFLAESFAEIDPVLPAYISAIKNAKAVEYNHRITTFFDHLFSVYRMLKLWNAPNSVSLCGLFHSAYADLSIPLFNHDGDRKMVSDLIGTEAEEFVSVFCTTPRLLIVCDLVIKAYPNDEEIISALSNSQKSKLQKVLPEEGFVVQNWRTGKDVRLSRRFVAIMVLITMADFSEQLYGYHDGVYDNYNGRMDFESGGNAWKTLFPGDGKPGLWMNFISRMGTIYNLVTAEENELRKKEIVGDSKMELKDADLVIPPIFNNCTVVLSESDELKARDLYWEAVCRKECDESAEALLLKACAHNPFIGEPHLVLGQIYLSKEKFGEGESEVEIGLKLLLEWGTSWDKRLPWQAWVSWGRVMLQKSREKSWPKTSIGIMRLGLLNWSSLVCSSSL
ncbi:hypothetical protein SUGI_1010950 [Cryptomeria japonica]|uniref:uncharacterized protein LOC131032963 n=1 Tax=Cryptomeria japonica TaxID=3369 RepID=UPI0024147E3A|nr:uncharacterized protein LOC131032963 [Cryptomeria japonica]GLJ47873.1 hypothetical protein SUGI_1010950 [Cryptomeria japonica]